MTDPIPLRGDRSAWDTVGYPHLHARDIEYNRALYHLPKNPQANQVPRFDGEKWLPVDPPGGSDPSWSIAGRLAVFAGLDNILVGRTCTIAAVYVYLQAPGSSGATTIDVNKNGESIFSAGQEPSVAFDNPEQYVKVIPLTIDLTEGDVLSLDIDAVAEGAADLMVVIALEGSLPIGDGSGAGDMRKVVYDADDDGIVDNARALDGRPAADFAMADHTHPGGGGEGFDPLSTFFIWEDFPITGTQRAHFSGMSLSSGYSVPMGSETNHPGIVAISASATLNSGYSWVTGSQVGLIRGGEEFVAIVKPASSNENTRSFFGYLDNANGYTYPRYAVAFRLEGNSLIGTCVRSMWETHTPTQFTVDLNTWYRLKILVNADATAVNFYVYAEDGTLLWTDTVTQDIPDPNQFNYLYIGMRSVMYQSNAAGTILYLDYMHHKKTGLAR